jgi:hypothetical protein
MLELMKWGFYVYSGLVAFSTLIVGVIFAAMIIGFGVAASEHGTPPEAKMGLGFVGVILGFVVILLLAKVVAVFFAGRYVSERTHHTFIFIVSIICMMNIPIGTALGVFSVVWLTKDSVKARFS